MSCVFPLTFVEGQCAVRQLVADAPELRLRLCMSGTAAPLVPMLAGEAARQGVRLVVVPLPFGTLGQHLSSPSDGVAEAFVLCPWDLVPELDWRTGVPAPEPTEDEAVARAVATLQQVRNRAPRRAVYLDAPIPPATTHPARTEALRLQLRAAALRSGAIVLGGDCFNLGVFLDSGVFGTGKNLAALAHAVVRDIRGSQPAKKVIVTDLDQTFWAGVAAEDGADVVHADVEGMGFKHFIYQALLARLTDLGAVLVAVSRNDAAVVEAVFAGGRMHVARERFATVLASYHPKSAQIVEVASRLNLGLDAFVFVDDNPVELEEVRCALPAVTLLQFPLHPSGIADLAAELHRLFGTDTVTAEDRRRTGRYQVMLAEAQVREAAPQDLSEYLRGLEMRLIIADKRAGDRQRAVQLLNKTNQFNLNGVRWSMEEVDDVLAQGGALWTGRLVDRSGDHGEILVCLSDALGTVRAFVMSCRVFQRRVEYAFLDWFMTSRVGAITFHGRRTDRNDPFWTFASEASGAPVTDGTFAIEPAQFHAAVAEKVSVLRIEIVQTTQEALQ
jgi:FkbH-like protein